MKKRSFLWFRLAKSLKTVYSDRAIFIKVAELSNVWPENVGILAIDVYFPNTYFEQKDLEKLNGASEGAYTIGLGQQSMAFCTDREDVNSISLTVTRSILKKYGISPKDIGFLMVATESLIDKSKSIKTILMDLFTESGNNDIEGLQTTNACYGATAAIFHAIDWLESSSWDGRYALVIAADIAVYESGVTQTLSSCASLAMLLGPNGAIVFDRKLRSTFMANTYDFCKPELDRECAFLDGALSIELYYKALDSCFDLYLKKAEKQKVNLNFGSFDAILFHAPYSKMVQRSFSRLFYLDYRKNPGKYSAEINGQLQQYKDVKLEDLHNNQPLSKLLAVMSKQLFDTKTNPSLMLTKLIGNAYTASLYCCLTSFLLSKPPNELVGQRVLLYSYGSGLASSMYSMRVSSDRSPNSPLIKLVDRISDIPQRLDNRHKQSVEQFKTALALRKQMYGKASYQPVGQLDLMLPDTYYLVSVNEKHRRYYERLENQSI